MRLFGGKREAKEQTPEPSMADRISQAERAVVEAHSRATVVAKKLYDLQIQHGLSFGNFGEIIWCGEIGGTTEPDLPQRVRALVEERSAALQAFHRCLNEYAGLKGALENATSNR